MTTEKPSDAPVPPDTAASDSPEKRLQVLVDRLSKEKPHPTWDEILSALAVTTLKAHEETERQSLPEARQLRADLRAIQEISNRIHEMLKRVDEARSARETAKTKPDGFLNAMAEFVGEIFSPTTTPVENIARRFRSKLDEVLEPAFQACAEASDALEEEFQVLSVKHSTGKPGFVARVKALYSLGLSESEIAEYEGTSLGAVHQARSREKNSEE
jgi:hypothetical protein